MSAHVSPSPRFPLHSNPFVECGIASQAVYEATIKRNLNHAALERLHQKIGDLSLEVQLQLPSKIICLLKEVLQESTYDKGTFKNGTSER